MQLFNIDDGVESDEGEEEGDEEEGEGDDDSTGSLADEVERLDMSSQATI